MKYVMAVMFIVCCFQAGSYIHYEQYWRSVDWFLMAAWVYLAFKYRELYYDLKKTFNRYYPPSHIAQPKTTIQELEVSCNSKQMGACYKFTLLPLENVSSFITNSFIKTKEGEQKDLFTEYKEAPGLLRVQLDDYAIVPQKEYYMYKAAYDSLVKEKPSQE